MHKIFIGKPITPLPLRKELYLSDVRLQAFCFSFANEEILSGQRLRLTRVYVFCRAIDWGSNFWSTPSQSAPNKCSTG